VVIVVYKIKSFRQSMHARLPEPAGGPHVVYRYAERAACRALRLLRLEPSVLTLDARAPKHAQSCPHIWLALVRAWPCHGCKTSGRTRHGAPS
jgi:hypothetical protein